MTKFRVSIFLLVAVILGVVGVATAKAAEDSWQASFEASGWVDRIDAGEGAEPTSASVFTYDGPNISEVTVIATNQHLEGIITELTLCKDSDCENYEKSFSTPMKVVAIQTYEMHLVPGTIYNLPYTLPSSSGGKGMVAEVISGALVGEVAGAFVTGEGPGKTAGVINLGLNGTGAMTCFAPYPGPLAPCIAGEGVMLPISLDFLAEGDYAIDVTEFAGADPGATVFELGDLDVEMLLDVDLSGLALHAPDSIEASGVITASNITLSYE